jgi:non-specific serine/threonine protein kinase
MESEHWQKIESLFHRAKEINEGERKAFLDRECGGDISLRKEVDALLASSEATDSFLEKPIFEKAMTLLDQERAETLEGQLFGHFKIVALIGKGGMGEVYLAEDMRLGRKVALKLLSERFTSQEQIRRFQREAKAISALNHPNILTIHDVGQAEGKHYIVTEYVKGETLRQRLAASSLSLVEALDITVQIAEALNVAHREGIIHRDIKPENVMLRDDSLVKVLDFGLAKLAANVMASPASQLSQSQITTQEGLVMGTVRYMSPEQVRGQQVDAQTDIWSLGVTLYEMLAGSAPFDGETSSDSIAAILKTEPPPLSQLRVVPQELDQLVKKTLQKSKEERYKNIEELLFDIQQIKQRLELIEAKSKQPIKTSPSTLQEKAETERTTGSMETPTLSMTTDTNAFSPSDIKTIVGPRPNNLFAPPTPFIGRKKELNAVKETLLNEDVRFVTLTGPGGTGKTRLSLQSATELLEEFEDGVFFVRLAPINDAALVASAIAKALDMKETGQLSFVGRFKEKLRDKRMLLVLDNFEHLIVAGPMIVDLLAACPRLKVLITSREILHLSGEHEFFVPPLDLPDADSLPPIETLKEYAGIGLFIQRARAVKPDFKLTQENAQSVVEICARLDGLPLAIELAAARTKLLSLQSLSNRLESRLKLLTGGARDLPVHQQTMRDTIAWSYDLLNEAEQKLFRSVAVFAGGFTLEAAEAICDDTTEIDVLNGLQSLVDKSLLRRRENESGELRFVMLATIKEYGLELLDGSGEKVELQKHHANYFLTLAEEAETKLRGPQSSLLLELLEQEHNNSRAALDYMLENDAESALRLAAALSLFWFYRSHFTEGLAWLEKALNRSGSLLSPAKAEALRGAGAILRVRSEYDKSRSHLEESLAIGRKIKDKKAITLALNGLAIIANHQGDYATANTLLEEALTTSKETNDGWQLAYTYNTMGEMVRSQKNYNSARKFYEDALLQRKEIGNNHMIATVLNNLGYVNDELGEYEAALEFQKESLRVSQQLGDKRGIAISLDGLASLAAKLCQPQRAAHLLGAAMSLRESLGINKDPVDVSLLNRAFANTRASLGDKAFDEDLTIGQAMPLDQIIAYALEQWSQG